MKKSWILLMTVIFVMLSGCAATGSDTNWQSGKQAYDEGDYINAISYFKTATELAPQDGDNFRWLGVAYYRNGQYRETIDACKKSLELPHLKNSEWQSWNFLAESYYQLDQIDLAITSQKKYIELNPNDSDCFTTLAKFYVENKQYDDAITAAKRGIELKSDNDAAYINLGAAYGKKKQYDDAMKALKKSIEINPKNNAYAWMGLFLMERHAYNEAANVYKKEIEAGPSVPGHHYALAVAYYRMGRYDGALAAINKAIELQTIQGGVGISIAIKDAYPVVKGVMNRGPAKKADVQAGDKIIEIDGKSTEGWNIENAVQNLKGSTGTQVILTIQRNENIIKKDIVREKIVMEGAASSIGMRGLIYRHKGNMDEAFSDAGMASSLNPSDDYVRISLGAAYLDRGQYDESIKLLLQVKDSPSARLLEATAYAKQGKTKEAVNVYLSIPEEDMSPNYIPQANDRTALLEIFKPSVKEHSGKAKSFELKEQYKEALSEYSEALKLADDKEAQAIQESMFSIVRKNPLLSEIPEDARKYALRGEMLVKEGSLEKAAAEIKKAIQIAPYAARLYYNCALINAELKNYPEAIRLMKIYLKASPDALDTRAAKDEIIKWEFMMEKGR
jgi:tetratricopeptide (TPR) repeat protein